MARTSGLSVAVFAGVLVFASCRHSTPLAPATPGPACGLSTTALAFDTVLVGASAERSVTLTNTGGGTLAGAWSSPSAEFAIVGTPGYALGAGASATFLVRFSPAAAGTRTATLATGSSACPSVSASGFGRTDPGSSPPQCALSTTSLDFGSVRLGESADRSFTISNAGGGTLTGRVTSSDTRFAVLGSPDYSLGGGASLTIFVRFTPVASGPASASLATGSSLCPGVSASGSSPDPVCSLNATTLDFGNLSLGDSLDRSFTITNTGDGILAGQVTVPSGDFRVVGASTYSLRAGIAATFTIRFKPTTTGPQTATVATGSTFCASVTATGAVQPGLRIGDILVADGSGLVVVDPRSGFQRLLTPVSSGGLADVTSSADGSIFAVPTNGGYVYQVDPISGVLTPITFLGYLQYPETIDLAPDGYLYVIDDQRVLVRVDPASGEQKVIMSGSVISAFTPAESGFGFITVSDGRNFFLNRIELATGRVTRVWSAAFRSASSLAMDQAGHVLVTDGCGDCGAPPSVWQINPFSSGAAQFTGGFLMSPVGVTVEASGTILVADFQHASTCDRPGAGGLTCPGAVIRIDPTITDPTIGQQTLLAQKGFFQGPRGITVYRGPGSARARRASRASRSATWMRGGAFYR